MFKQQSNNQIEGGLMGTQPSGKSDNDEAFKVSSEVVQVLNKAFYNPQIPIDMSRLPAVSRDKSTFVLAKSVPAVAKVIVSAQPSHTTIVTPTKPVAQASTSSIFVVPPPGILTPPSPDGGGVATRNSGNNTNHQVKGAQEMGNALYYVLAAVLMSVSIGINVFMNNEQNKRDERQLAYNQTPEAREDRAHQERMARIRVEQTDAETRKEATKRMTGRVVVVPQNGAVWNRP